jgi:hypothetical protein
MAQVRQKIGAALDKKQAAQNAIARSLAAIDLANAWQSVEGLNGKLEELYSAASVELERIDASWPAPDAQAALPPLHARLAFLTKWRDQLRESLLQLQLS